MSMTGTRCAHERLLCGPSRTKHPSYGRNDRRCGISVANVWRVDDHALVMSALVARDALDAALGWSCHEVARARR